MEKEIILKALYYIKKNQILQFYKLNPKNSGYAKSFIYAISNDCYPIFHSDNETEIYENCFDIKKDFIQTFLKNIDELWLKKQYKTFYELEDIYGHEKRFDMIVILRYCFLDNRFMDNKFWETITKEGCCPIEASNINSNFSELDVF